ncbi:rRNA methylase [Geomicrobium sp. JCM 19037]|uniref:TrmH family RNA methyltransferase n=1 Tax=Geomicrobium sp. JCM 19037 TaxID=1460634 RepID=UPI00045F1FE9|nr:rRNA methylase [Geomicrobium sp. JCM 19037]
MITSVSNAKMKQIKKLWQKKYRQKEQQFLVEGPHLVEEAVEANQASLLIKGESAKPIKMDNSIDILDVTDEVMQAIGSTQTSQGWMAVCIMQKPSRPRDGNVLLVDGVQDPGNLGTIIRTAEAAGMAGIVLSDATVDPYNDKVIRSSQGAIFHIPIQYKDLEEQMTVLREEGKTIIGTAMEGKDYRTFTPNHEGFALVLGNEGAGVQPHLLERTDHNVTIPIFGNAESLNVAVAAGILIYQWS